MKNKILLIILLLIPMSVHAASASGTLAGSASVGDTVTFTVNLSQTAAWNIRMSGSGSTSNCSTSYADVTANGKNTNKALTLSCKATSEGSITFTATGDITADNGSNSNVSISKSISIHKAREKESEARLSSLTVKDYKIDFDKDKYEYSIEIEPTVKEIEINASAISKYARVSGNGIKKIEDSESTFTIESTSETGIKKTYTINVSIVDNDPIKIKIGAKEYTILKNNNRVESPTNSIKSSIKIKEYDIPSFKIEKLNIELVSIKDNEGNTYNAIYKDNKYELYNENKAKELLLYISYKKLDGYKEKDITINNNKYKASIYNNRFYIVYAMNLETGKYDYYKYDSKDNTFMVFKEKKERNIYIYLYIASLILNILLLMLVLKKK